MIKITLDDLNFMIKVMKKNNVTQLYLDATDVNDRFIDLGSIDFDMRIAYPEFPNFEKVTTILTIDK